MFQQLSEEALIIRITTIRGATALDGSKKARTEPGYRRAGTRKAGYGVISQMVP
jgi:hypothetical protein